MASLERTIRKDLEAAVRKARKVAEAGAKQALEQLAVHHHEPWAPLSPNQRLLRNRLRAHGRQLGDQRDSRKETQKIERLVQECAYEHWHRLLFSRFLAENDLLIEPSSGVPISIDECRELAREQGVEWMALASGFAEKMLPQIFRTGDPVLEVPFPIETKQALEDLLASLARDVFLADDSLGWVYQFWQAEYKDAINESGVKIGATELPAVTQLFTEDYMVEYLLHNSLGAWWCGKFLSDNPDLARNAGDENQIRKACKVGEYEWTYLRLVRNSEGIWNPASGRFEHWPRFSREIRLIDPSMGSGHFLVFALPILMTFRMIEEGLTKAQALHAVLRENLFGLEIDQRCTQIAAFNLALTAWRLGGHQKLPLLNIACSGLAPNSKREDWIALAKKSEPLQRGMGEMYDLFEKAPILGSLIEPAAQRQSMLVAGLGELRPLLDRIIVEGDADELKSELAVTASGLAKAFEILDQEFTLVTTNVPYLGRGKQADVLKEYCESCYPDAKADLATCFVERCLSFCGKNGTAALVSPQNWWFLGSYKTFRAKLLRAHSISNIATLGEESWQSFGDRGPKATLMIINSNAPRHDNRMAALDALPRPTIQEKIVTLLTGELRSLTQEGQYSNPDHRITVEESAGGPLLSRVADSLQGVSPADFPHYGRLFWEVQLGDEWKFWQSAPNKTELYGGRSLVLWWNHDLQSAIDAGIAYVRGEKAWGRFGIACRQMRELTPTLYTGEVFDTNTAVIVPSDQSLLPALWAFCSSDQFSKLVRRIDNKVNVTNASLVKVPFDVEIWKQVASEKFPNGLPTPIIQSPTQWLFDGRPEHSLAPLQVAVARLVGYRWPRQTGVSFPGYDAIDNDDLTNHEDGDGIVCLTSLRGEAPAAERLSSILSVAYGSQWTSQFQNKLLVDVGYGGKTLEDWLRNGFFEQHCELFEQRPFVWHIWDGLQNGFGALVNYHRLAAPNGEGRRLLEKLIFAYLGDWIERQRVEQRSNIEGAEARLAAAERLKIELTKIIDGEPPYDIFVRWKPVLQQPVGWEPDLNDGVRINARPFLNAKLPTVRSKSVCVLRSTPNISWDKDRGREPMKDRNSYPWLWSWDQQSSDFSGGQDFDGNRWNDLHYSRQFKIKARSMIQSHVGGQPV